MRTFRALSFALLGLCHLASASTNAFDPEQLAYNLRTTVEAYEKYGGKNSKWDGDAKACNPD